MTYRSIFPLLKQMDEKDVQSWSFSEMPPLDTFCANSESYESSKPSKPYSAFLFQWCCHRYNEVLKETKQYHNPFSVHNMCLLYGLSDYSSLYRDLSVPEEENYRQLRYKQESKWALQRHAFLFSSHWIEFKQASNMPKRTTTQRLLIAIMKHWTWFPIMLMPSQQEEPRIHSLMNDKWIVMSNKRRSKKAFKISNKLWSVIPILRMQLFIWPKPKRWYAFCFICMDPNSYKKKKQLQSNPLCSPPLWSIPSPPLQNPQKKPLLSATSNTTITWTNTWIWWIRTPSLWIRRLVPQKEYLFLLSLIPS